jgi:hypothetical protein
MSKYRHTGAILTVIKKSQPNVFRKIVARTLTSGILDLF